MSCQKGLSQPSESDRRREGYREGGGSRWGWMGGSVTAREREREDSDARERASVHPTQLKAQGSCACVLHACVRSNGNVGALIWAGLCAECVCRQHAIPIHREQRCLHEEHRRTAAEVKLSLDSTQRHACTYIHTDPASSERFAVHSCRHAASRFRNVWLTAAPVVLLARFVDMPFVGRLSGVCMQLCFCQIAGPCLRCSACTCLASHKKCAACNVPLLFLFPTVCSEPLKRQKSWYSYREVFEDVCACMQDNVHACARMTEWQKETLHPW